MVSIATNDDLAGLAIAASEEGKGDKQLDKSTAGDGVNNTENGEKSAIIDFDIDYKTKEIEHAKTGENREVCESLTEDNEGLERPKRNAKPSTKAIQNRIQSDKDNLGKLWGKVEKAITLLQDTPNSLNELRSAISQVRSWFNNYHALWLSYVDFLANVGTLECRKEHETQEAYMRNHKQFVETDVAYANERKEEIVLEMGSIRSGSRGSSLSSTALRARARADAAAAKKELELQKNAH